MTANQGTFNSNGLIVGSSGSNFISIPAGTLTGTTATNVTFFNSASYKLVINSDITLTIKLFFGDDEHYYELSSGELVDFPDDVDFNSLEDVIDAMIEQSGVEVSPYISGGSDDDKDYDIIFHLVINRNGVIEHQEVTRKFSEINELLP